MDGELWLEDSVDKLPGIGQKRKETLQKYDQIVTALPDDPRPPIPGFTGVQLAALRLMCVNVLPGASTDRIVDHRLQPNPYLSRYGDAWEKQIAEAPDMKKFVCITTLIEHIVSQIISSLTLCAALLPRRT